MDLSEKPQPRKPRVIHGPHRIRLTGVVAGQPLPREQVLPSSSPEEFEQVGEIVEIPVEIFSPEELK